MNNDHSAVYKWHLVVEQLYTATPKERKELLDFVNSQWCKCGYPKPCNCERDE